MTFEYIDLKYPLIWIDKINVEIKVDGRWRHSKLGDQEKCIRWRTRANQRGAPCLDLLEDAGGVRFRIVMTRRGVAKLIGRKFTNHLFQVLLQVKGQEVFGSKLGGAFGPTYRIPRPTEEMMDEFASKHGKYVESSK